MMNPVERAVSKFCQWLFVILHEWLATSSSKLTLILYESAKAVRVRIVCRVAFAECADTADCADRAELIEVFDRELGFCLSG